MKAFISYRHTGEKLEDLQELLGGVCDAVKTLGVDTYCTLFSQNDFDDRDLKPHEIMQHAFSILDESDVLLVIQASESKSEGMLMEVGYCIAKNIPVVVAVKEGISNTYLPDMATTTLRWNSPEDLSAQLRLLDTTSLTS